ncbi:hypothetical protein [Nocardia sp. NPDC050412]|uniref:hypothetical protein n=1 Tax=Nocardia sp. NPDC050412 TaxID=3364320 RepID=UPI0037A3EBD3
MDIVEKFAAAPQRGVRPRFLTRDQIGNRIINSGLVERRAHKPTMRADPARRSASWDIGVKPQYRDH